MTTLPTTTSENDRPSRGDLAYAAARYRSQAHSLLLRVVRESGLTQKELATRVGMDEATVSRVLSRPRNLEADTFSSMIFGACGAYISMSLFRPHESRRLIVHLAKGADQRASSTDKAYCYYPASWARSSTPELVGASSTTGTLNPISLDTGEHRIMEMAGA